ncbi:hypothetical protein PtA15_5A59 [Puccinia triticina]|uniref:Uncharacterized protein n=1 Tax=Puccinia triticina TaxID=208348 RepID=A0ABY7CII0_9BASI|nr:uncharacterized protein PtA15_5A59 [Puccinia triticina]WAQ84489.1 hypothetical protein PtA15_5A59 [Puccinia triticina]
MSDIHDLTDSVQSLRPSGTAPAEKTATGNPFPANPPGASLGRKTKLHLSLAAEKAASRGGQPEGSDKDKDSKEPQIMSMLRAAKGTVKEPNTKIKLLKMALEAQMAGDTAKADKILSTLLGISKEAPPKPPLTVVKRVVAKEKGRADPVTENGYQPQGMPYQGPPAMVHQFNFPGQSHLGLPQFAPPNQWTQPRPPRQRGQGRNGYQGKRFNPEYHKQRAANQQSNPGNRQMVIRDQAASRQPSQMHPK